MNVTSASDSTSVVTYIEPDFNLYSKLDGTAAAARVFIDKQIQISDSHLSNTRNGVVMSIEPSEFGKVCWTTAGLYGQYHINDYLNLLASSPSAVLISKTMMADMNLQPGDSIYYSIDKQQIEGVVYAAVNYWPGINPFKEDSKYFVVSNLRYLQASAPVKPYQIWYKRAPGATSQQIVDAIKAKNMTLLTYTDVHQSITTKKNDPLLLGTNGAMTMGFVVTMAISMIGFFIYWILSIQSRTLQFGIFRAMGMTSGRVILTLVCEQIMISGVAIVMGLVIGGIMCQLFVPLLSLVYSSADQVPPFHVIASRADYINLYSVIGFMLAAGLGLLGVLVSRIKVAQAIKLGED
jgi:putative ABC transport system permease protein